MILDPARALPVAPWAVAVGAATGGAAILALAAQVFGLAGTVSAMQLAVALQTVAVVALLGAGTLCLSRWRLDSGVVSLHLALACWVLGLGAIPLSGAAAALAPQPAAVVADEAVRLVVIAAVLVLARASLRDDSGSEGVGTTGTIPRALGLLVTGVLGVLALGWMMTLWPHLLDPAATRSGLAVVEVALLLVLAAGVWRSREHAPWARHALPFVAGLTVVRLLDAVAADVPGSAAQLGAVLLEACLSALVVVCVLRALIGAIEAARRRAEATARERDDAAEGVVARDAWREELSHDAVNAISGLRAALSTLARYDDRLDHPTARRLREAALAEVGHLEHLVARSADDQPTVFDVAQVIGSVVEARRAGGLEIEVAPGAIGPEPSPGEGLALGRPGDLATVLHNLLINADVHAAGSSVRVSVSRGADHVGVAVSDRGPGIAAGDRARVFQRGVRGPHSTSTGLGLYVARELMREQGGDLELVSSAVGCHFVATLPAAMTEEMAEDSSLAIDEVGGLARLISTIDRVPA